MESDSSSLKIVQLKESNYHAWKIRIQHVLTLKGLKKYIVEDPPTESTAIGAWIEKDSKTQAIIGLSLSEELLENVRDVDLLNLCGKPSKMPSKDILCLTSYLLVANSTLTLSKNSKQFSNIQTESDNSPVH